MSNSALYSFIHSKKAAWVAGIVLFGGILFFAWNNRISIDDMFFYGMTRDMGIKGMVLDQYHSFSGRYTAYTLNGFTLLYFNHVMLAVWNVVSIVCFFLSLRFFIRSSSYLPSLKGAGWIFLFAAILFGCTHPGEEFFWYTQVNTYLWSATCALFILGVIVSSSSSTITLAALIPASFFVGGSSENIFIQLSLLATIVALYNWKSFSQIKKIIVPISLVVLMTAGYFTVFSHGNEVRSRLIAELNATGFFEAFVQSVYSYVMSENAIISYVWALPLVFALGFYLQPATRKISFIKVTIAFGLLMMFFIAPSAWALREPAPARALITCDTLTFLYLMIVIQKIKLFEKIPLTIGYTTGIITVIAAVGLYSYECHNYSRAYDIRDAKIRASYTSIWYVDPLPPCRILKALTYDSSTQYMFMKHSLFYYAPQH